MSHRDDDSEFEKSEGADETEATDSAEGDICRSTVELDDLAGTNPQLVYEPQAVEHPGNRIEVWARRENPDIFPWGFWGGVLAALVVGYVLFSGAVSGAAVRFDMIDTLLVIGLTLGGLVAFRLGRRSRLEGALQCEIDIDRKILSWPTTADGSLSAVAFDDIEELTFGIVEAAVDDSSSGRTVDAATVYIRDDRGRDIPVIEASTDKGETHLVARLLAEILGRSVNYVGTGVDEWVDRRPVMDV